LPLVIILLSLSFAPLFAQSASFPNHTAIYRANSALASTEPQGWRPISISSTTPTIEQPFYWAWFSLSPASPSVDSHISNLHPPSFFWLWGESHKSSLRSEYVIDSECGISYAQLDEAGKARLSGEVVWSLENETAVRELTPDSANPLTNPLSLSAWSSASVREGPNLTSIFSKFNINFRGLVIVPYQRTEMRHYLVELTDSFGNRIEKCETDFSSRILDYSYAVGSARSYEVENGALLSVKISPADGEQLSFGSALRRVDISSRRPHMMEVKANHSAISTTHYADYSYLREETGFLFISRQERNATTKWGQPEVSAPFASSLHANSTSLFLRPTSLDAQNNSFAYQYHSLLTYPFPLGLSNVTLAWQDDFGDVWNASWILMARSHGWIAGTNTDNAMAFHTDARAPPAKVEKKDGPLPSANLPQSDFWRGAQAFFPSSPSLPLIAGGLLLAPFALWLFLLLKRRSV